MLKIFIIWFGLITYSVGFADTNSSVDKTTQQPANNTNNETIGNMMNAIKNWFTTIFSPHPESKNSTADELLSKTTDVLVIPDVDYIVVNKSERKMYMKKSGQTVWVFNIYLGGKPVGKKTKTGDLKTPEGLYRLGFKNSNSAFYKSIYISYPDLFDRQQAQKKHINPGSAIVIHGMPNKWKNPKELFAVRGKDWTDGCIALNNKDMDKFWRMIKKDSMFIKINP